jgi:hypothetical protein
MDQAKRIQQGWQKVAGGDKDRQIKARSAEQIAFRRPLIKGAGVAPRPADHPV